MFGCWGSDPWRRLRLIVTDRTVERAKAHRPRVGVVRALKTVDNLGVSGGNTNQPKKKRRWLRRATAFVAVALLVAAGLTVYLLQRPPAVWTQAQDVLAQSTPEERAEIADGLRQQLNVLAGIESLDDLADESRLDETTAQLLAEEDPASVHIDRIITMRLTNEELVALVSDTFEEWMLQRGYEVPGSISDPVVMADGGQMRVAFAVTTPNWHQVFSGDLHLEFSPDGMAEGRVESLTAG